MTDEQNQAAANDQKPALEQREFAQQLAHHMVRLRTEDEPALFAQKVIVHDAGGQIKTAPLNSVLDELIKYVWPDHAGGPSELDTKRRVQLMEDLKNQAGLIDTLHDVPALQAELKAQKDIHATVIDVMAHAGQLHQMAGLLARESFLSTDQNRPESIDRVLYKKNPSNSPLAKPVLRYSTADDAVAALKEPSFEMTFTGHPTNTNSIASMKLQRELAAELSKLKAGVNNHAEATLKAFAKAPLLPENDKGTVTPLTVQEETDTMLYFLGNVYEDLPRTYKNFDNELKAAYKDDYRPEELKLGLNFHSWGSSGDKDGNKKVNGDTSLGAVSAHRTEILNRYAKELEKIDVPQKQVIADAAAKFTDINARLQQTLKENGQFTPEEFAGFSAELKQAGAALDQKQLESELFDAAKDGSTTDKKNTLNLLRRVRTFGFSFGHIEYRETAEEYERVMAELIPEYGALYAPVQESLSARKAANAELATLKKTIDAAGKDAAPSDLAAYQVKQKELAVIQKQLDARKDAFGEQGEERTRILNDVLDNPAKLEALAAKAKEIGAQARGGYDDTDALPIAYHTLKRMELARDFPDMLQNNVLAECGGTANMLEALLLQHAVAKDGVRAKMGIVPLFEEHATLKEAPGIVQSALLNSHYQQHLQEVSASQGIPVAQQVQLAHSDNAKRAGVPASRALVFRAHDEIRKMMEAFNQDPKNPAVKIQFFEGGSQSDAYRGGVRSISAGIKEFDLHEFCKMTYQGGDLLNYFNLPFSTQRLLTKSLCTQAEGLAAKAETPANERKPLLSKLSERIINGFDELKSSYIDHLFNNPRYVSFLNKIGYAMSGKFGNLSSRAPSRDGKSVDLTDINTTRAIGISETLQHAEIAATWVGVTGIEETLAKHVEYSQVPEKRHEMYKKSAVFRDIVDRMMYGLMRSDLNHVADISKYPDGEHPLMPQFRQEYAEAFTLCMEAYTGQSVKRFVKADLHDPVVLQNVIKDDFLRKIIKAEVYPHIKDTLGDQQRFVELAHHMDGWDAGQESEAVRTQHYLVHNMMDTVHHGRLPLVDDPSYARRYCDANNITRQWVDTGKAAARGV